VIVHAGFAISIMDQKEAKKTLSLIKELLEIEEEG
jgi:hydrogenase maturation factor